MLTLNHRCLKVYIYGIIIQHEIKVRIKIVTRIKENSIRQVYEMF